MDYLTTQFGEILEQGQQAATNAVKQTVSDTSKTVSGQIGIKNETANASAAGQQSQIQLQNQLSNVDSPSMLIDDKINKGNEQTADMIKDFYAPSDGDSFSAKPQNQEEYETQQKLLKIRQSLHDETYYNPLIAYEHKKQERPAEVAEKEEQQKMTIELEQKKQDQNIPLAVIRAQTSAEVKLVGAG
jgi:hypothetical protein